MDLGGRLQLRLAEEQLPGRVIRPDLTWWGANVPEWSPDGTRVLLRDRDLRLYIATRTGSVIELSSAWGQWQWLTNDELVSVHDEPGKTIPESRRLLARMDARTGRIISERVVPVAVQPGLVSLDALWIAFSEPGPHGPTAAFAFEFATDRLVKLTDAGAPIGWLPDGRLVLGIEGSVEVITLDTLSRERVFGAHGQVFAQPHHTAVVVADPQGVVWTVVPGSTPIRTTMPSSFRGAMHSLSSDGQWLSFTEVIDAIFPAVPSQKTGVVSLRTGAISYACERECRWLAIR